MTKDRDFKKLVRKRMSRTGESYSTAMSRSSPSGRTLRSDMTRRP
jgi:hypothetical protein